MILTVTLNSSIDKLYLLPTTCPETVMRVKEVHNSAGGKGLNVSRVAAKLGEKVTAMGFVGGYNGQYLESLITDPRIQSAFTHVKAETRCCINCWDLSTNRSTEYLEPGAPVTPEDVDRFFADLDEQLPEADVVAVSGSAPKGVPMDAYGEIIRRCRKAGKPVLIDTSGERLALAAAEKPFFIKPNTDEILQLLPDPAERSGDPVSLAEKLHLSGIDCAVLSMGADGAVMACETGVFRGIPPEITPKNTVGCGDSMVAGFAVGFTRKLPWTECFRMALAVSAANALSLYTGDFDEADYAAMYAGTVIEKVR